MRLEKIKNIRSKLKGNDACIGTWQQIPHASISEILGYWKRVEPIMYAIPEETSNTKKINSIISGNFEFKDLARKLSQEAITKFFIKRMTIRNRS